MSTSSEFGHFKSDSENEGGDILAVLTTFIYWCQDLKDMYKCSSTHLLAYSRQALKLRKICKYVGQEDVMSKVGMLVNITYFLNNILGKSSQQERFENLFPGTLYPQAMSEAALLIMHEVFERKLSSLDELDNFCSVNQCLESGLVNDSPISQPLPKKINDFDKTSEKDNIFVNTLNKQKMRT